MFTSHDESMNTYISYLWLQLYDINEFNLCAICLWLAVIVTVKSEMYIRICSWVLFDLSFCRNIVPPHHIYLENRDAL